MTAAVLALVAVVAAQLPPVQASPEALRDGQTRLEAVRAELAQRRAALKDLDDKQRSLTESMGELDESLAALADDAREAQQKLERLRTELAVTEQRAGLDEKDLLIAKQRLAARLRVLYLAGEGGAARALLGAEGYSELALRRRFLQSLAQNDARLAGEVRRLERSLEERRQRLRDATAEAELTARVIVEQKQLIESTRGERQAALARIASERALQERQERELDQRREQLGVLVGRLIEEGRRRPLHTPAMKRGVLKGGLAWPTEGTLIRKFGVVVDKESRAEIVSNGIELRADEGTPVQAVADGRIAHVGWLRGFGRIVLVDHGDGHHTLSAHLSRVAVGKGDAVARGQTIGFVGDTESPNGPKLYFELRDHGRPKDPVRYLRR